MKIVLAFDSFKGSLSAQDACRIVSATLAAEKPAWTLTTKPVADGGEGTSQAILASIAGEWHSCKVMGPLPDTEVEAGYTWFPDDQSALVEMATASGITLVPTNRLNPMLTTTYGTGQLIMKALERNPRRLRLAVGGSATVDGGAGMAMAMGWRFQDASNHPVPLGGGGLEHLARIDAPPVVPRLPPVEVLCDVENPLCGKQGAAFVYGPQKGATPEMVGRLDAALARLASLAKEATGRDCALQRGSGAAGGLAAGAIAFLNAALVPGIDTILDICGVESALRDADWVITGEGRLDNQSFQGKVVSGILKAAHRHHVKVAVIAGQVALTEPEWRGQGVSWAGALAPKGTVTAQVMREAEGRLVRAAQDWLREAAR